MSDLDDFDFGDDPTQAADAFMADVLRAELEEIGYRAGQDRLDAGDSLGEAIWHAVPRHCLIGGAVWHAAERGVRRAYGAEDEFDWQEIAREFGGGPQAAPSPDADGDRLHLRYYGDGDA